MVSPQRRRGAERNKLSAISYQLSAISYQLEPCPKGSPNTKRNGSTDLRCVVFLGSPYGANPSTAGLWESAPKGRGGVFADTLNVCPRRRAPRHGWRGRGMPGLKWRARGGGGGSGGAGGGPRPRQRPPAGRAPPTGTAPPEGRLDFYIGACHFVPPHRDTEALPGAGGARARCAPAAGGRRPAGPAPRPALRPPAP